MDSTPTGPVRFLLGVADLTLETVQIDLANQNLVVTGPPLSGKSTALETAVEGLRAGTAGVRFAGIGGLTSPLATSSVWDIAGFGRARHVPALQDAVDLLAGDEGDQVKLILVVDSLEDFEGMEYNPLLEAIVRSDAVRVLAACDAATLERAYAGWMTDLERNRVLLVLRPGSPTEIEDQSRSRLVVRPGQQFPPGRGVLVGRGRSTLIQVG